MGTKKKTTWTPSQTKSLKMLIRGFDSVNLSQHFAREILVKFQWALFFSLFSSKHQDEFMLKIKKSSWISKAFLWHQVQSVSCSFSTASSWCEAVSSWNLKKWQVLNRVWLHFSNKDHDKFGLMPALEVDFILAKLLYKCGYSNT